MPPTDPELLLAGDLNLAESVRHLVREAPGHQHPDQRTDHEQAEHQRGGGLAHVVVAAHEDDGEGGEPGEEEVGDGDERERSEQLEQAREPSGPGIDGKRDPDGGSLVCTNARLHDQVLEAFASPR